MKDQFSLDIKSPCGENFENFTPTSKGGFCNSCQKEVIDFTKMNSKEIINFFQNNSTRNTCGRFKSSQLKVYDGQLQKRNRFSLITGLGLALLSLFSFNNLQAQEIKGQSDTTDKNSKKTQVIQNNITVKGQVKENGTPLPGVNIYLERTAMGTSTDFNGNFEFPEKLKEGDVLVFNYIGFKTKKIKVTNEMSKMDITLEVDFDLLDEIVLTGKVASKKIYKSKNN